MAKPTLLTTQLPIQITKKGEVVAEVVEPGMVWGLCEKCGDNTRNVIKFKEKGTFYTIILCDECAAELL